MSRYSSVLIALVTSWTLGQSVPTRSAADAGRAILHYRLGWEALRSEAWSTAATEFRQAIEIDPTFKLAHYGLGRSYMGLRRFQDASKAYETCRNLYAGQTGERFKTQMDADRRRQDDQALLQIAVQQLSKGPQTVQTQLDIQRLNGQARRIQLRRDVEADPSFSNPVPGFVSLALGSAYFRSERFADAEREYKAAVESDPTAGEPHNNLAVLYMLTGRLNDSSREVALAEKAGFRVNPQFKKDLADKKRQR